MPPNGQPKRTRSERVSAIELPPGMFQRLMTALSHPDILIRLGITAVTIIALCIFMQSWSPPFSYRVGYTPTRNLASRVAFRQFDPLATAEAREKARNQAEAVYAQNPESIVQLRAALRNTLLEISTAESLEKLSSEAWQPFELIPTAEAKKPPSQEQLNKAFSAFRKKLAGEEPLKRIEAAVGKSLKKYETDGLLVKPADGNQNKILVYPQGKPEAVKPVAMSEVLLGDGETVRRDLADSLDDPILAKRLFAWLYPKLAALSTLNLDQERTEANRERAEAAVENVHINYSAGQTLAKAGEPLTVRQIELLRDEDAAFYHQLLPLSKFFRIVGSLIVLTVWAVFGGLYLYRRERQILTNLRRFVSFQSLILLTVLLAQWASRDPWHAELVPVLLFGQIIAIVYQQEVALLFSGLVALVLVLGIGLGLGEIILLVGVTASAIIQLNSVRSRSKLIYVGILSGLLAVLLTWAIGLLDEQPLAKPLFVEALRNGLLTLAAGFLMTGLLPLVERIFGILTDISLLELGDVSHPLLQELVRRAPSTYNHSITVGSIAEAAASAIGARGLLVRVGAYFHDIGKMLKPGYFIENQGEEANRHESLLPAMSTLIIIAHIKDGANLARQHHLPEPIVDFILQHHGTTLVGYFFERASQQSREDPNAGEVDESTFRYPGPKPQTKEAAVMMLADAVESASRTLVGPTPARIESLVREIADRRLRDGQFDESGLTLRELRTIEDSMIKSVTAIYHSRVKYPDQKTI